MNKKINIALFVVALVGLAIAGKYAFKDKKPKTPPPITQAQLHIISALRNIDRMPDESLRLYFSVNYNGKTTRFPASGYVELRTLEKKLFDFKLPLVVGLPENNGMVSILDHEDKVIGEAGVAVTKDTVGLFPVSHCVSYTYTLEYIYPYDQFPTFVPKDSRRFKCTGSGKYFLELQIGSIVER